MTINFSNGETMRIVFFSQNDDQPDLIRVEVDDKRDVMLPVRIMWVL